MIITCVTARYLPNLRYLARLCEVDRVVILDLAPLPHQYKNSFISRNRISDKSGRKLWLSVPVLRKGMLYMSEAKIDGTHHSWIDKHINSIRHAYPRHEEVAGDFVNQLRNILRSCNGSLMDLNLQTTFLIIKVLQLDNVKLLMQSTIIGSHSKEHRMEATKALGATGYLAGRVESGVMEKDGCIEKMASEGIDVLVSPELDPLVFPADMVENLSAVHAICTVGPEKTRKLVDDMVACLRD